MRTRATERIIEAIDPALRGQFECERLSIKTKGFFFFLFLQAIRLCSHAALLSDSYLPHQASIALLPTPFLPFFLLPFYSVQFALICPSIQASLLPLFLPSSTCVLHWLVDSPDQGWDVSDRKSFNLKTGITDYVFFTVMGVVTSYQWQGTGSMHICSILIISFNFLRYYYFENCFLIACLIIVCCVKFC